MMHPWSTSCRSCLWGGATVHPESAVSDSTWEAVVLREYGSLTGDISFGLVAGATIRHDGSLVVVDRADCALVVIDRPAGTLRSRLGGCGQGPGESIGTISHLEVLDDSTLLVAREFVGRATVETIDRDTGDPRDILVELLAGAAAGIYAGLDKAPGSVLPALDERSDDRCVERVDFRGRGLERRYQRSPRDFTSSPPLPSSETTVRGERLRLMSDVEVRWRCFAAQHRVARRNDRNRHTVPGSRGRGTRSQGL